MELVAPPNQNVEPGVPLPDKIVAALARFREVIPVNFDSAYVDSCSKINPENDSNGILACCVLSQRPCRYPLKNCLN
jgi:hypothetical protein